MGAFSEFSSLKKASEVLKHPFEVGFSQTKIKNIDQDTQLQLAKLFGSQCIQQYQELSVAKLLDVLTEHIDAISIDQQKRIQQDYIKKGWIFRGAERLPENKRKELASERTLSHLLQIVFSPSECYFSGNNDYLIDPVVILPSRVTDLTQKRLHITSLYANCQNFKEKIKRFQPFTYKDYNGQERTTNRMGSILGTPVTFRIERIPYSKDVDVTGGEKRKSDFRGSMNTYADVYSLVRGQQKTVETSDQKMNEFDAMHKNLMEVYEPFLLETVVNTKDLGVQKKLKKISQDLCEATSFHAVGAYLRQLQEITGKNLMVDTKHLEGADNRIIKRRDELAAMCMIINDQLYVLEDRFHHQESALHGFCSTLYSLFYSWKNTDYAEFHKALFTYYRAYEDKEYRLDMAPFSSFYREIRDKFGYAHYRRGGRGAVDFEKPIETEEQLNSLQPFFLSLFKRLRAYQLEHHLKLGDDSLEKIDVSDYFFFHELSNVHKKNSHDAYAGDTAFQKFTEQICMLEISKDENEIYEILKALQK